MVGSTDTPLTPPPPLVIANVHIFQSIDNERAEYINDLPLLKDQPALINLIAKRRWSRSSRRIPPLSETVLTIWAMSPSITRQAAGNEPTDHRRELPILLARALSWMS